MISSSTYLGRGSSLFERFVAWACDPQFKDGLQVTENTLIDIFAVSRTPMREVIQQSQMIGFVRREPNRPIELPKLSKMDMENLSYTREQLEGMVTMQVSERLARGEISLVSLRKINRRMQALAEIDDVDLLLSAGLEFHAEMRALSGNDVVDRILEQLMIRIERYRRLVPERSERSQQIVEEHEEILSAIEKGSHQTAAELARLHIRNAREFYTKELENIIL